MRFLDARSLRASLETRLNERARNERADIQRLRRSVAFERLVARLAADNGKWILKGGTALEFRYATRARATRDIDIAYLNVPNIDLAINALEDALSDDPFGDFFEFVVTHRRLLSNIDSRGAVARLRIDARLDGRTFELLVVDLVTSDAGTPAVEWILLPGALTFAGIEQSSVAVIDLRVHWAEKLHAYLTRFGDRANTRVKDLVDLVILVDDGLAPNQALLDAVTETFNARGQELPGLELPSMAAAWQMPFAEMATEVHLSTTSSYEAHDIVQQFWAKTLRSNPQ